MKKLLCVLAIACASSALAAEDQTRTPVRAADYRIGTELAKYTEVLNVPPGFVKHWIAPKPFGAVIPGNPDVIDVMVGNTDRELVFMVKPGGGETNILLLDNNGEQVANLLVVNPPKFIAPFQGVNGWQVFHKDNYDYLPQEKK